MRHRLALVTALLPWLLTVALLVALGATWIWQNGAREQVDMLRGERFRFSLNHIKSALESGLHLGNATAGLPGAEALITQVRGRQPDILSIDVFDAQGDVVFSTDPGGMGLKLPAHWAAPCLSVNAPPWSATDADGGVQCVGLVNAFGQAAGGVLMRHRMATPMAANVALPDDWPTLAAWAGALVLVLGLVSAWAALPIERQARRLRHQLEAPEGHTAVAGHTTENPHGLSFGPEPQALAALAQHAAWLSAADAQADLLDNQEVA